MTKPKGMPGAGVHLGSVSKSYGTTDAVTDLSLDLEAGSFTALLGPSGCGKSTTLAMIAGLEQPDSGDISIGDIPMRGVSAESRPVSLVFQKPLLFPHLDVAHNVGFGLRMQGKPRRVITERVAAILEKVQLSGLADRKVGQLSGGQEQRVALARALVLRPRVLLLDEPFSQLDASLRTEMRQLVRRLHEETGVTTLFVTHDQAEAVEVAGQIVLMLDGRIEGRGTPEQLYTSPPTLRSARFFGATNEIAGHTDSNVFRTPYDDVVVPDENHAGPRVLVIRPESVRLDYSTGVQGNAHAMIRSVTFAGTHSVVAAELRDGQSLTAHVPIGSELRPGADVPFHLSPERCAFFDKESA